MDIRKLCLVLQDACQGGPLTRPRWIPPACGGFLALSHPAAIATVVRCITLYGRLSRSPKNPIDLRALCIARWTPRTMALRPGPHQEMSLSWTIDPKGEFCPPFRPSHRAGCGRFSSPSCTSHERKGFALPPSRHPFTPHGHQHVGEKDHLTPRHLCIHWLHSADE